MSILILTKLPLMSESAFYAEREDIEVTMAFGDRHFKNIMVVSKERLSMWRVYLDKLKDVKLNFAKLNKFRSLVGNCKIEYR